MGMDILFIDVGIGLSRMNGALAGMLRTTYYAADIASKVRDLRLAEMADEPNDIYRANIQISELNAMNACLAVVRYKQLRGFYVDDKTPLHLLMGIESLHTFGLTSP